jgi:LDH2 family malate/lactate/ureidoglycolate dehydrogenase
MDVLVQRSRDCPRAEGFDEILMPGEIEARTAAKREKSGIPYGAELDAVQADAKRAGVAPLAVSERPLDS